MKIHYNIPKINQILSDLSVLTGTIICFADSDFRNLTGYASHTTQYCKAVQALAPGQGKDLCLCYDTALMQQCKESRRTECSLCHGGLYNIGMPVMKNDMIVGYLQIGSFRTSQSLPHPTYQAPDHIPLQTYYEQQPFFTDRQLESHMHLLPHILFDNAITIEFDSFISRVTEYILANLQQEITIRSLCSHFHVSKSYLYESFHAYYDCTVNEYLSAQRIKKAQTLLLETSEPIYRIAELVGIENHTYFCKLFKRKTGISPGDFRKNGV